jgi:hypothetical protein
VEGLRGVSGGLSPRLRPCEVSWKAEGFGSEGAGGGNGVLLGALAFEIAVEGWPDWLIGRRPGCEMLQVSRLDSMQELVVLFHVDRALLSRGSRRLGTFWIMI